VKDAAKSIPRLNGASRFYWGLRHGQLLMEFWVRTSGVVMQDKLVEHATQVCFTEDDEVIKTLLTHGSYPAFGNRIGVGRLKRGKQYIDAF
jgi:hypothetical protein